MKIFINKLFACRRVEIFALDERHAQDVFFYPDPEHPHQIISQEVPRGRSYSPDDPEAPRPLITLDYHMYQELLAALVAEADTNGVKPPSVHLINGELNASKDHLQSLKDNNAKLLEILKLAIVQPQELISNQNIEP